MRNRKGIISPKTHRQVACVQPGGLATSPGCGKLVSEGDTYMTIHLPKDLETSIQSAVITGRFASVDDAMAEAARLLLQKHNLLTPAANGDALPDPVIG